MPLQDDPRLAVPAHALAGLLGSLPARPAPVEALPEAMLAARALVWDAFEAGQTTVFEAIDALDHASALTDDGRKNGGVVYTPPALARSMCKILAPKLTDRLLEPSCGRGVFVFSVLEEQRERFNLSWEEAARWSEKHLFASELDAQALADLGWLWRVHFHAQGVQSDLAAHGNLRAGDALFGGFSQERFDAVLGNPPYVRIQNLADELRLSIQAKFSSCAKGNVDLFYAFCQQALDISDRVCFVVPNSLFTNASAKALRAQLAPRLHCAIDFGSRLIFAPIRAYSCVFLAERAQAASRPFVFWRSNLPEEGGKWLATPSNRLMKRADRFAFLPSGHSMASDRLGHSCPVAAASKAELGARRPNGIASTDALALGEGVETEPQDGERENRAPSAHAGKTLGDIADIFAGIATLSDASFMLPPGAIGQHAGQSVWEFKDPLDGPQGALRRIPLRLAPRFLKLTKARDTEGLLDPLGARIACPYGSDWKTIPEATLAQDAPDLLAWLVARKPALLARDKGKTENYEAWFGYGRRQGFQSFDPKDTVYLISGMTHGPLAPLGLKAGDLGERFLFASGFVIRPRAGVPPEDVEAFLRSDSCWAQIRREGRAWAGGKDYRTFGARLLRALTV